MLKMSTSFFQTNSISRKYFLQTQCNPIGKTQAVGGVQQYDLRCNKHVAFLAEDTRHASLPS